jgi:hypothetical protein
MKSLTMAALSLVLFGIIGAGNMKGKGGERRNSGNWRDIRDG